MLHVFALGDCVLPQPSVGDSQLAALSFVGRTYDLRSFEPPLRLHLLHQLLLL